MGATLADGGVNPLTGERVVDAGRLPAHARRDDDRRPLRDLGRLALRRRPARQERHRRRHRHGRRRARAASARSRRGSTRPATASRGSSWRGSSRAGSASTSSARSPAAVSTARRLAAARGALVPSFQRRRRTSPTSRRWRRSYAPVVRLVEQTEECGPGEPYEPIDVDRALRRADGALRGPWNATDLVKIAPVGEGPRRPLRLPPRLPGQRAQPGLRLRALGAPHHRGQRGRRCTRTSPPRPTGRASSRCSTGSSTPTTTGTTCTRATGR